MHNKSEMYKLFKDKLKAGISIKDNRLIAELRQLPSSSCDIADALALSPMVHCNASFPKVHFDASFEVDKHAVFILPEIYDSVVRYK